MASDLLTDHEAFMVVCAVRYALGRQSYAPSIVMKEVRRLRSRIPKGDIDVIVDSIRTDLAYLTRLGGTVAYGDEWTALADELASPAPEAKAERGYDVLCEKCGGLAACWCKSPAQERDDG